MHLLAVKKLLGYLGKNNLKEIKDKIQGGGKKKSKSKKSRKSRKDDSSDSSDSDSGYLSDNIYSRASS